MVLWLFTQPTNNTIKIVQKKYWTFIDLDCKQYSKYYAHQCHQQLVKGSGHCYFLLYGKLSSTSITNYWWRDWLIKRKRLLSIEIYEKKKKNLKISVIWENPFYFHSNMKLVHLKMRLNIVLIPLALQREIMPDIESELRRFIHDSRISKLTLFPWLSGAKIP